MNMAKCHKMTWKTCWNDNKWDYITWHLSDYSYHQSCYKLVGRDLSSKAITIIPQQIDFTGILERDIWWDNFFCRWKPAKIILEFSLDTLIARERY